METDIQKISFSKFAFLAFVFFLLFLGSLSTAVFAQCTGCTTTIGTNVPVSFTANNQKICITSATYNSNITYGAFTNASVCFASNVNWTGGAFCSFGNPTFIDLYGTSTFNFGGCSGISGGLTFNIRSTATYTGPAVLNADGIINVEGVLNSSALNANGGIINISTTGVATIGGTSISSQINNAGNLRFASAGPTFNGTAGNSYLGGNIIFDGPVTFGNGTVPIIIAGNVTVNGNFTANGYITMVPGASLTVNGNMNILSNTTLAGTVAVSGTFQNTAPVVQNGGSTSVVGLVTLNNTLSGGGVGGCGLFCPSGTFQNNSTIDAGSGLSLCKAPTSGAAPGAGVGVFVSTTTSQPTSLSVTSTTTGFRGAFTIATNTGTNGYIVVRKPGSQPATPASFTNYSVGSIVNGTTIVVAILSPRTVSSFIDIQPSTCGTQYFYAAYAYQVSTTTGTVCGSMYYINTLNPATTNFTPSAVGTTGSITGSSAVCSNNTGAYSVATVSGATGYLWGYTGNGVSITSTLSSATFTFTSTATSGILSVAGFSACVTSSGSSLTVTVTSAPTIITQPSASTVCVSNNTFFTVSVSGTSPTYSWQLSTNSGTTWTTISNGAPYSGATTTTLSLTNVLTAYSGYRYRSIVSSSCSPAATSTGVSLTVNPVGTWLGTLNSDWSNAANWCGQPTLSTDNAIISSTAPFMPIISTSSVNINSVTIGSSSTLTLQSSNTVTFGGNFINNGQFIPNTGKVFFGGTSAQIISGSGINLFNDVTVTNTVGVTLSNTISVSGTMTLNTNAKYSSGSFTTVFLSTASQTARLSSLGTGATFTGNITMQRYVPARPTLRLMSSAVSGATIADWKNSIPVSGIGGVTNGFDASIANINTVWYFNEAINAPTTYRYVGAPNTSMPLAVGAGYRVYVRGDRSTVNLMGTMTTSPTVMSVTNTPNVGNISLPVTFSNYGALYRDGTNLVGNPYPSEINWDAAGWTKTNIDNALYLWDPNLGTNGQYFSYVGGVATPARTNPGIIASSQAFFVKANAASPVLSLTEAVKTVAGHTANFRTSASEPDNLLRLKLVDSLSNFDETVVRFREGSKTNFEKDYDAYKIYNSTLNILSNPVPGIELSINTLGTNSSTLILPLSVYSNKKGKYAIQSSGIESMVDGASIYLKDAYLGTWTELKEAESYKFQITSDSKSSGTDRFSLVLYRNQVTTGNIGFTNGSPMINVYPNPNHGTSLSIDLYNFDEREFELTVKDMTGNTVLSKILVADGTPFYRTELSEFGNLPSGVYIVHTHTANLRLLEKVILVK